MITWGPSYLHNNSKSLPRYKIIVKVHGVLPSSYKNSVSSRKLQFQKVDNGDSGTIVTSLIPAHTCWANDYATLGPSELQPPLIGGYFYACTYYISRPTPGRRQTLYGFLILQCLVFLVNSRRPRFHADLVFYIKVPPYSKVTELICKVPSLSFARTP